MNNYQVKRFVVYDVKQSQYSCCRCFEQSCCNIISLGGRWVRRRRMIQSIDNNVHEITWNITTNFQGLLYRNTKLSMK